MPKNPTRKEFFFFFFFLVEGWQPLPHCQDQLCSRRVGKGRVRHLAQWYCHLRSGARAALACLSRPHNKGFIKEMPSYASCPQPLILG